MKILLALKLIFRNWWHNKTFTIIAILSLAIGIACTNLLAAFVIHEYNVEVQNPNRDRIYMLLSKLPHDSKPQSWVASGAYQAITQQLPEIEDAIMIGNEQVTYCKVGEHFFSDFNFMRAEAHFAKFFPVGVVAGDLHDVLASPDKVALSETFARRLFGNSDPMDQLIDFSFSTFYSHSQTTGHNHYRVGAILKDRQQSLLGYDVLAGGQISNPRYMIMVRKGIKGKVLETKINELRVRSNNYGVVPFSLSSVRDTYFNSDLFKPGFRNGERTLLQIGLFSALFILIIACFNYVNLSFSRTFQQLRAIHIQKLMAAESSDLAAQLFTDTFLTVCLGFLLSLLLQFDLLPLFNSILDVSVSPSFFFNLQVLPVTFGFTILLAIMPALYMSYKLPKLSINTYKQFYTGKAKQRIMATFAIVQFVIAIGLIVGTLTARDQLGLLKKKNTDYPYIYSLYSEDLDAPVEPLKERIKLLPGVAAVSAGETSLQFSLHWIFGSPSSGEQETLIVYDGDADAVDALNLKQLKGIPWHEAIERYGAPVLINSSYAQELFPNEEIPIGDRLSSYDKKLNSMGDEKDLILAGVVEDFFFDDLKRSNGPALLKYNRNQAKHLQIRLNPTAPSGTLKEIRTAFVLLYPDNFCRIDSAYQEILKRNKWTVTLSDLLLMYSLISLFLICFGLFGTALYVTEQRTKEIGIRKVNGASTWQIIWLLNKQFIYWVVIALIIAIPITWYLLNRWLETLVYREELHIFTFLLSALVVLAVTLLTVSWHSYRAASSNPVDVLRSE